MSETNLKLVIATARFYNALFLEINKNIQSFNLTISEFGVLEMLLHKGDQPVQKVAEKILVTSGTMTSVVDKLQNKGLVLRQKCEKDQRIFYVCLTPKGRSLIAKIFPKHAKFLDGLLSEVSEEIKKEVTNNLNLVLTSLNK
ncbi:MAG: MarR family transcriptional regulator [Candidatus Falkowbacteria bacterium]